MLVIRMQRTGRKGHAQFRVVVQDSRRTPTSGKIVANLGYFNPHTKTTDLNKEKAAFYLEHGAQPSDRVARLLKSEGVKLPAWVKLSDDKKRSIRNLEKLRRNRPAEPTEPTEPTPEPKPQSEADETTSKTAEPATPETDTPVESADETADATTNES